jgi:galactokinase
MTRHYLVPGRVELVGKHVDYAGGRSLTCAVDLAIAVHANPLRDAVLRVRDSQRRRLVEVALSPDVARTRTSPLWSSYVVAVARRFARDFPDARTGVDVRLHSELPPSAGLSSSSALVVAIATALADANHMEQHRRWHQAMPDAVSRAEYFAAMETGAPYLTSAGDDGVGVRGGAQDHVAIVCAEADSVGQFSYLPARLERRVPWPTDHVLAIGVSGIRATKTGNVRARYNRASDATGALLNAWNATTARTDATLANAFSSGPGAAEQLARLAEAGVPDFPASYLVPRLAQFREEVEVIVPGVGDAIRDRDYQRIGMLVDRSQALAESALENQIPETILLARSARECGAVAASAFGAGFGGAVWAMVRSHYEAAFPLRAARPQWFLTKPAGPARLIE